MQADYINSIERNRTGEAPPTVSVVIPCYNYAGYLPDSVRSVAGQTFRDLEVIIVNDGSTDDSLEVARGLLDEYKRELAITLIDQENRGHPSISKNTGYSQARGRYYFTLDSDDMIMPDYVEKTAGVLDNNPDVDIVYPGYRTFGESDWFHIPPDFDLDSLKYWDYIPYSSVFRKEVYEKTEGYETDSSHRIMEDWDFWLRVYSAGFRFKALKEPLLLHRTHHGSLFTSSRGKPFYAANVRRNNSPLFDDCDMDWARKILGGFDIEPYKGARILFIVDHFPPDIGGAERFATELGFEFARLGFLVDVATLSMNRNFHYYNGLNIFEFEYEIGPYEHDEKPGFEELRDFVKNGEYDLVLVKGGIRNWAMWSLEDPGRYPTVFVPIINRESIEFLETQVEMRRKLVERLVSARAVISLTETGHDAEFYCEHDIPFSVIPNASDFVSPTMDFKREMGIPSDTKLLLCVGSYYHAKNQLWMVEKLKKMPGNWVMAMMGRVLHDAYYHEILGEVRGDYRFIVLPAQDKRLVASAMEQADLLLLPSIAEAFGRVVLEAMSHRLPWVASADCAGLKNMKGGRLALLERDVDRAFISSDQVVKEKSGLDAGRSMSPFVEEVRRLLSRPAERVRLGREGYRQWRDGYQWPGFARMYLDAVGMTPDPSRSVSFRKNTIEPKPARPDFIDFLRAESRGSPLVSIVLITYNRPELLETAIGSVIDQTYENFELIVINDGGTDVLDIINKFRDPRILYLNEPDNAGPGGARNKGLGKAHGEYIAYLDDDDIYYPTHLETLIQVIGTSQTQVAYTDSFLVSIMKEGDRWLRKKKELTYSEDFDRNILFADNYIPIICMMHDANLIPEIGGFDEDLRYLEDWDLWIRMAIRCDFKHVKEITCEVSRWMDGSRATADRQKAVVEITKTINDKHEGLVYKARDLVNRDLRDILARFESIKKYSLTDALGYLEAHLEAYTGSPRLEYVCAGACREQRDWTRTRSHLQRCLELDPGHQQAARELEELDKAPGVKIASRVPAGGESREEFAGKAEKKGTGTPGGTPIVINYLEHNGAPGSVFEQLNAVTDDYSLVLIDNGSGDHNCLKGLNPAHLIKNPDNAFVFGINSALKLLPDEFVAVLRNDVLILDEGWLDNIVSFLERRPDVGLVGIAGWHSVSEKGVPDLMTPVSRLRGHPDSNKPTWRFTEVAAIDDPGWVMRNTGIRLSEDIGDAFLSVDLSLQYINSGFRVYVAALDFSHTGNRDVAADRFSFARDHRDVVDNATHEGARLYMRNKWDGVLPLTRGFTDESYVMNKVEELARQVMQLEAENAAKADALEHVRRHEKQLERALAVRRTAKLKRFIRERFPGNKK